MSYNLNIDTDNGEYDTATQNFTEWLIARHCGALQADSKTNNAHIVQKREILHFEIFNSYPCPLIKSPDSKEATLA